MLDNSYKEALKPLIKIQNELCNLIVSLEVLISNKEYDEADRLNLFIIKQNLISVFDLLDDTYGTIQYLSKIPLEKRKDYFLNDYDFAKKQNDSNIKILDKHFKDYFDNTLKFNDKLIDEIRLKKNPLAAKLFAVIVNEIVYSAMMKFFDYEKLRENLKSKPLMEVITKDKFIEE